jgi:2-methylcitrate dehydratase PrpD
MSHSDLSFDPAAPTTALADLVAQSRLEDIPPAAMHEAKRALVNFFACALSGSADPDIDRLLSVVVGVSGTGNAPVIGRSERLNPLDMAFVNAASANVFDFDDTHPETIIHPTAPVAPALLALAAGRKVSGRDLLHAFVLGVEVECRLGNAISPGHYRSGWHITSSCGVFGAAAAAAKLLGLNVNGTTRALGIAASQASGLVEALGTSAKSVGVGNAARNGVLAALLAKAGATAPERPIEGRYGFLAIASNKPQTDRLTTGLGHTWEILTNTYKPYPCGVVLNPVVDACLLLRQAHPGIVDCIDDIEVRGNVLLKERTDRPPVNTGREGQVSARHTVAVVLLQGAAGIAQFQDAAVHNAAARRLGSKVRVVVDEALTAGAVEVRLRMSSGETVRQRVDHAKGSPERPLSDADIEAKLRTLAGDAAPWLDTSALADQVWQLEQQADLRNLLVSLTPEGC